MIYNKPEFNDEKYKKAMAIYIKTLFDGKDLSKYVDSKEEKKDKIDNKK